MADEKVIRDVIIDSYEILAQRRVELNIKNISALVKERLPNDENCSTIQVVESILTKEHVSFLNEFGWHNRAQIPFEWGYSNAKK